MLLFTLFMKRVKDACKRLIHFSISYKHETRV